MSKSKPPNWWPAKLSMFSGRAQLIISYHNFENTPQIDQVIKRMTRIPADIYKLVTTARKPSDAARVLAAAKSSARAKMVVLAMGELGFPTRVLSTSWGGVFTYAAPMHAQGTAAGQVSARQLRHLYRIEKFTKSAKVYGVIADPVRHSLSPVIHNRAFQSRRLDAVYLPFLVSPPQLRDFFVAAEKTPIAGFSVTIPHKQKVIRYLDIVDPAGAAHRRGEHGMEEGRQVARNQYRRRRRGGVRCRSTSAWRMPPCWWRATAGRRGERHRRSSRPARRCRWWAAIRIACARWPACAAANRCCATRWSRASSTCWFTPRRSACFPTSTIVSSATRFPAEIVFDMVYNPLETLLIQHAREQGKTVIPGLEMFIEQAAQQFEIWTGETAPRAVMEKAAMEALEVK